jgi:hypothetical protein
LGGFFNHERFFSNAPAHRGDTVNFRDGAGQPGYEIRQQFLRLALELI